MDESLKEKGVLVLGSGAQAARAEVPRASSTADSVSPEIRRKLRIGIFADSPLQPRWVVEGFAKVVASDFAEVVAVVEGGATPAPPPWLLRAYGRVDTWLFGSQPDPSERIDLSTCVP